MQVLVFDRMEQCTEAEVQAMLPLVSAQRREQALRYKHTFGQFCSLKSWLMLYEMLDERMKGLMDEWVYNEHGKPSFIPSPLHPFTPYFSISHCKHAIAVAVDVQPIGVDIESIRHADEDLIQRVMSEKEKSQITNHKSQIESARAFTRLWTQKEAIVKWRGTGIESFDQLQNLLIPAYDRDVNMPGAIQTYEKENYIYSVAWQPQTINLKS